VFQGALDRFTLWINDRFFRCDNDLSFHGTFNACFQPPSNVERTDPMTLVFSAYLERGWVMAGSRPCKTSAERSLSRDR
jgi:hypothetical protein